MSQITVNLNQEQFKDCFGFDEPSGLFNLKYSIPGFNNPNGNNPFQLVMNKLGRCYWLLAHDHFQGARFSGINTYYQGNNARLLRTIYPNARRVLDVGGNVGNNTISYSEWCQKVESFEPTPTTLILLKANIKIAQQQKLKGIYWQGTSNGGNFHRDDTQQVGWYRHKGTWQPLDVTGQIAVHEVAVGDQNDVTLNIVDHSEHGGHNHIETSHNSKLRTHQTLVPVTMRTIDSYGFNDVDFIKIDVEGAELGVLRGATETIKRCRPAVQMEIMEKQCSQFGYAPQDLYDFLVQQEYIPVSAIIRPMNQEQALYPWGTQMPTVWFRISKYMDRLLVPKERLADVDFGVIKQADNQFESLFS
jgi:FkbM family methyltransferase